MQNFGNLNTYYIFAIKIQVAYIIDTSIALVSILTLVSLTNAFRCLLIFFTKPLLTPISFY